MHGQIGFILHMAAPVTVAAGERHGQPAGIITTSDVYVPAGSLKNAAGDGRAVRARTRTTPRRSRTGYLLTHDGTKGVHNPPFYNAVINATNAKVAALP